jgi:hypothetical protein
MWTKFSSLPFYAGAVLLLVWFPFSAGHWTSSSLSVPRDFLSATSLREHNLAFFAGGQLENNSGSAVVDIYNASPNSWITASLYSPRWSLAATSVGNLALFAGGTAGTSPFSAVVDIYNASSNNWTTASLSQARATLAATSVDGIALFAGGVNSSSGYSAVVDIYNALSNNWTIAALSQGRQLLAATSVGSRAIFAGGFNGETPSSVVDIYDAASNNWTTASLSQARGALVATSVDDLALFAGGTNPTLDYCWSVVDIYNASSNNWTTASLSQPRAWLTAASVGNLAFFVGGMNVTSTPTSAVVDIYNASSNSWTTASLSQARDYLAAASLKDRAIFAGGFDGHFVSSVVDIYDDLTSVMCTDGSSGPSNPNTQCNGYTVSFNPNQPTFQLQPAADQNISVDTTLFNVQSSSGTSLNLPLVWQSQFQTIPLINSSSTATTGLVYTTSNANYTLQVSFVVISNSSTVQLVSGLPPVQTLAQSVKFAWYLSLQSMSLFASNQDTLNWSFDIILNNLNVEGVISQLHDSGQFTMYQVTDNNQNAVVNLILENQALLDNTTVVKVNSSVIAQSMGDGSSVLKVGLVFPAFTFALMYDPNLSLSVLQPDPPGSSNQLYYLFLLVLVPFVLVVAIVLGVFVRLAIYSAKRKKKGEEMVCNKLLHKVFVFYKNVYLLHKNEITEQAHNLRLLKVFFL